MNYVVYLDFLTLITVDVDAHFPGQVTSSLVQLVEAPLQSHRYIESPENYKVLVNLKYTS